ncbi:beta-lactamase/transpeptidase-like protein [Tothia fuscella]|uniref:Beta-lactamase/transpeptidase-like protein n=1 Tax=Tothia fuscella TaxID=1048955 RepID=A0A9P4NU64_9PEZI|nr:beta-lactamase/transpeptidase-like protein [Tothia fuscella]
MGKAMETFKQNFKAASSTKGPDGIAAGTAIAISGDGRVLHSYSTGTYHVNPKAPSATSENDQKPFDGDVICWIASCTKLMATVATMQCVERGLLDLDADVGEKILPEFKDIQVLEKMEDDGKGGKKPVLRAAKGKVTLRNLLTHTSGVSYEFTNPTLAAWRQWAVANTPDGAANHRSSDIGTAFRVPLLFDPDQGWAYGYGIDWAGEAVMRVTKQTLEAYMAKNIWGPLGMNSTTFDPWVERKDLAPRVAGMMERDAEKNLAAGDKAAYVQGIGAQKYSGGGGAYSTANDYAKLVASLLGTINGFPQKPGRNLLQAQTLNDMIAQTNSTPAATILNAIVSSPMAAGLAGNIPGDQKVEFGLGGLVNRVPISKPTRRATDATISAEGTGRAANSIQWCGLPNCHWWISPGDGVCGVFFTQVLPPGDNATLRLYEEFEGAVLRDLKENQKSAVVAPSRTVLPYLLAPALGAAYLAYTRYYRTR